MKKITLGWLLAAFCLVSCGDPGPNAYVVNYDQNDSLNGDRTYARPEIGRFALVSGGTCTASLIRPNVAITASHCVDYQDMVDEPVGLFLIEKQTEMDPGRFEILQYEIDVVEARVIPRSLQTDRDIALLRLAIPVPADIAEPLEIAREYPDAFDEVAGYGYGRTGNIIKDIIDHFTGFKKRVATWPYAADICIARPGDSGGPVVREEQNTIVKIFSRYHEDLKVVYFADPVSHFPEIVKIVSFWEEMHGVPEGYEPMTVVHEFPKNEDSDSTWEVEPNNTRDDPGFLDTIMHGDFDGAEISDWYAVLPPIHGCKIARKRELCMKVFAKRDASLKAMPSIQLFKNSTLIEEKTGFDETKLGALGEEGRLCMETTIGKSSEYLIHIQTLVESEEAYDLFVTRIQ